MPSYNIFYSRIRNYFDGNELRLNILKAIYRVMPLITAVTYIAVLALLFVRHDARLIRATCYPCIVFVAASIFRKCYNRPRPYEGNDAIIPLISKEKRAVVSKQTCSVSSCYCISMLLCICASWNYHCGNICCNCHHKSNCRRTLSV